MLSLAAVYAGFAVTMVMRPVGAAVFGRYSDLRGRKPAMLVAVMGVGLVTARFGALPTVPQIGTRNPGGLGVGLIAGCIAGCVDAELGAKVLPLVI